MERNSANPRSSASSELSWLGRERASPNRPDCAADGTVSLTALLARLLGSGTVEFQTQLRRIRSPTQYHEKERHETGKSSQSGKRLPASADERRLGCGWLRDSAQARRARELALFVGDAFTAERSSAVWTSRGGFAQRMKQAARMAQGGGFAVGRGQARSHRLGEAPNGCVRLRPRRCD